MWNFKTWCREFCFSYYLLRVTIRKKRERAAAAYIWLVSYTITLIYVNEWCTCSDKAIDIIMREEKIPAENKIYV